MNNATLRSLFMAASLAVGAVSIGPAIAATKAPIKAHVDPTPAAQIIKSNDDPGIEVLALAPGFNPSATRALLNLAKDDSAQGNPKLQAENANKARILLQQGADPGYNDGEALVYAAKNGQLALLQVLHEEGHVDLNIRNGHALLLAAMRGRNDVINYLIDKGMDPDGVEKIGRPIAQAAGNDYVETVELLKKRGADINIKDGYPLAIASMLGALKGVEKLVALNADVNAGQGLALRAALDGGSVEVAQFLLDHGADPSLASVTAGLEDVRGNPEKYAGQGNKDVLAMVTRAREARMANPGARAATSLAAIIPQSVAATEAAAATQQAAAAKAPKTGVERYEGQLQYDEQDGYLLAAAALTNDLPRMKELLDKKSADPNFNDGLPLESAAGMGYIEAMQLLLDNGADINLDDGFALMAAADTGQKEAVQFLIDHGIDVFARDVELYLEQMQVVKEDPKYAKTKYARPVYDEMVGIINAARKARNPDYIPKVYQAIPAENGLFRSTVVSPKP